MRTADEIIGRAANLLCLADRCGLENKVCAGETYTRKQRESQRLIIYGWLKNNNYIQFMTEAEKFLLEKKVGNPFIKKVCQQKFFECEAIETLLWTLGLTRRLSSYNNYILIDWQDFNEVHLKLKTNIPDSHEQLLKKIVMRSEEEIVFQDQIAMLWHWRAVEGKNPIFKTESVKDILIEIFGDDYRNAINRILGGQKDKQDFKIYDKYVYQLNSTEIQHLYKRTAWRYHAFEWLLTEEDWDDVNLNT